MRFMFSSKRPDTFSDMPDTRPTMGSPMGGSPTTLIAQGVKVEGDFSSQGDVSIEGEVQGTVKIVGRLSVGTQAKLKADVTSEQATIAGSIEGNVTVSGHLELTSTAKVVGDVVCETASVDSGAQLFGKVTIGKQAPKPPKNGNDQKST
jgi:cytoskeletal protein CcmA (bactofilin family)